ncbi:MAG: hypothetical protein ACXQTR_06550 [Candidatus Methanospirareceae archaeon]
MATGATEKRNSVGTVPEDKKKEVIGLIRERLPERAEILLLSLTGSRAFGWADERYDYDIHGLFACDKYWDWVHLGKHAYDINLYELSHALFDIKYQHFVIFMNFSNPFHLHPDFDYEGLMSFCTLRAVKQMEGNLRTQIQRFHFDKSPRTALHAYRIAMVALHYVETREFELNIYRLNEKDGYGFTMLEKLKECYLKGRYRDFDIKQVKKDLKFLYRTFKKRIAKIEDEEVDMDKAEEWFNRMKERFYKSKTF